MKRRFSQVVIKWIVGVMIFSMISPALPAAFAEEMASSQGASVSADTYGNQSALASANESDTATTDTYTSAAGTTDSSTWTHVPSTDPASIYNDGISVTTATYDTYADGTYLIDYKVLRTDGTGRDVSAFRPSYDNASTPGWLVIKDGKYEFSFRGKNADGFLNLTATQHGVTEAATYTTEQDGATQYTRISFPISDWDEQITLQYEFNATPGSGWLVLDRSTLQATTPITPSPTPVPTDPDLVAPATGVTKSMNFKVLQDGKSETSMMDSYMQKPATLVTTADNKRYIQVGINSSSLVTELQTDVNGEYKKADIIARDTANNTRTVQFPADALTGANSYIAAKVHVIVPGLYDSWYVVQFQFDNGDLNEETVSDIEYSVYKDGTEEVSMMDSYMQKPAQLVTLGDQQYIRLIVNNSNLIRSLQTEQNHAYTEVKTVSENTSTNTRVVEFPIESVSQKLNAYTHVVIPDISYDHWYVVQFKFTPPSSTPVYADGTYTLKYNALHATKDQASTMARYFSTPATFTAQNGKYDVSFTINNSSTITSFKTRVNDTLVETEILSSDPDKNERTIRFPITNLDDILDASVHIKMGAYEMDHAIRLKFDASALTLEPKPTPTPEPELIQPEPIVLKDGTYTADFKALQQQADVMSEMNRYLVAPAEIVAKGGSYTVSFALNSSSMIPRLQIEQGGVLSDTKTVSEDIAQNQRIVSFTTTHLQTIMNAQVDVKAGAYEMSHPLRLQFDTPQSTSKTDGFADGKYSASLTAIKYGTNELSVMDGYIWKPVTVVKKSGKYYVQVKLKNSNWIKTFKVGGQNAEVVEESASADTRTVQFQVTDLPRTVKINTHVIVPGLSLGGIDYDHTYDVDLKIGSLSAYEAPVASATNTVLPLDFKTLASGTYKLPFSIVMPGIASGTTTPLARFISTEQPVQLTVENDQRHVAMTLQHASDIQALRIYDGTQYTDAEVIRNDTTNNTKTFKFTVSDYTKNVPAQLVTAGGVSIASTDSNTVYEFELKFDTSAVAADTASTITTSNKGTNTIADGVYRASYRILKNGAETDSVLTPYLDRTAKLTAKDGRVQATITITDGEALPAFMTDFEGKYTAPTVVAQSKDGKSRTITFEVPNLDKKLSIFAHVNAPERYLHNQKMGGQLLFDRASLQATDGSQQAPVINEPSKSSNTTEPKPVQQSGEAGSNNTAPVPNGVQPPAANPAVQPAPATNAPQKYSIGIKAYKDQTSELSVMNDYIHPTATLIEQNGTTYVELTLNNGSWMPVLQVEQDGVWKDVEKVSSTGKTTIVRFKVNNPSAKINAYTHVVVPGLIIGGVPYDHWYTIQLQLNESSKKAW